MTLDLYCNKPLRNYNVWLKREYIGQGTHLEHINLVQSPVAHKGPQAPPGVIFNIESGVIPQCGQKPNKNQQRRKGESQNGREGR